MKTQHDIAHVGTLGDEGRTRMTFDENSIAHLMSVLTDLYSDKELAVIREYSTNAYDSHRAAGIADPIEVTLPTSLTPMLIVRDHGVGMSVDDITQHFSKYGWSSKRDNDDEVGMLGLGCKAGLTYTTQFTMHAIKNGVKASVLVTRDTDGTGLLQVLDTCSTDERNGVTIEIPVRNVWSMVEKAKSFFAFWDPGTVLVNGEAPDCFWTTDEGWLRMDEDVLCSRNIGTSYVVMGNVPYPVSDRDLWGDIPGHGGTRWCVVARVPIGTVNFTPSREALQMTKRTRETLAEISEFFIRGFARSAQMDIDRMEALEALNYASNLTMPAPLRARGQVFTWRGNRLHSGVRLQEDEATIDGQPSRYGRDSANKNFTLRVNEYHRIKMIVVGGNALHGVSLITKQKLRKKLTEVLGQAPDQHDLILMTPRPDDIAYSPWLDNVPRFTSAEINAVVLGPAAPRKPRAKHMKYRTLSGSDTTKDDHEVLPDDAICWTKASEQYRRERDWYLTMGFGSCMVVGLQQEERFKREHPDIPHVDAWVKSVMDNYRDYFTPIRVALEGGYYMTGDHHSSNNLSNFAFLSESGWANVPLADWKLSALRAAFQTQGKYRGVNLGNWLMNARHRNGVSLDWYKDEIRELRVLALDTLREYPLIKSGAFRHSSVKTVTEYFMGQALLRGGVHLNPFTY